MRFGVIALSAMLLSGCLGTPELPLLSDVDLAEDAPEAGLVAPDVEAPETVLEELQSVENVPEVPVVEATPEKPRRGLAALFGRRKPRQEPGALTIAEDTALVDGDTVVETTTTVIPENVTADTEAVPKVDEAVVVASAQPQQSPRRARKSLFGPRRARSDQAPQADPNIMLPFGQVGSACGIRGSALGKEVDRFPARGKGYRLFDTDPSRTGPRTHYITGFKDGCPRKFTASLALLGSPVLHQQLLSAEGEQGQHSTDADIAFQKIRAQICHRGRGKVCPEKHEAKMEKSMAFVTTYERFGGPARWTEILLHNGKVEANSLQQ